MAGIRFWVVNFFLGNDFLNLTGQKFSTCLKNGNDLLRELAWSPFVSLQPRPQTLGLIPEKIVREEPWGRGW